MIIEKEINKHFENYIYNWSKRFYFVVGGYGSSKSYHTALKLVLKSLQDKDRKIMVVREVFNTLKESCYDLLVEVIEDLGLSHLFRCSVSPLGIRCLTTGTRFIFRGTDNPGKLKSVNGVSIIWIEEANQISYKAFKELNGRLRTLNQSMHIILTNNPESKNNWTFELFFTKKFIDEHRLYEKKVLIGEDTYYHHSTVEDNKFVPPEYIHELNQYKIYDPYLYDVARKGHFGVLGTRVLPQVESISVKELAKAINNIDDRMDRIGMDFGFETSYNCILKTTVDCDNKYLYIWWEYYKNKMTDDKTAAEPELQHLKKTRDLIRADSAEPKAITYYNEQGFNMIGAEKFQGSRLAYTKKIKRFKKIFISESCPNCYRELKELTYKEDKNGNLIPDQFNIDPHSFSAVWYALDDYEVSDLKNWFGVIEL